MRDHDGIEWLRAKDAAERFDIDPATIAAWVRRGTVEAHRYRRATYVRVPDVMRAEHAWRTRKGGHRRVTAEVVAPGDRSM